MKSYYVVDDEGYMVASGHYNHDAELKFYRAQHGARLQLGAPPNFVPTDAHSMSHRWHVDRCCWDGPAIDIAAEWEKVRYQRDKLLAESDWRVVRAMEAGEALAQEWQDYRQALRDVTEQSNPMGIEWPAAPNQDS